MNVDPAPFLREFGLSVIIVVFLGWVLLYAVRGFVPVLATAIAKRIDAGTKLVEVTTATVEQLPQVIAQSGKETRDAIASYEKSVIASETRILDAFTRTLIAIKDEIFDAKQDKIDQKLGRLSRSSIDSDNPPAKQ